MVAQMTIGQKVAVKCPSHMAYGDRGVGGGLIPPNSDLNFDIELLGYE
jgi:FKBP-type peptidyl-prolyl cis-trans isomerase